MSDCLINPRPMQISHGELRRSCARAVFVDEVEQDVFAVVDEVSDCGVDGVGGGGVD